MKQPRPTAPPGLLDAMIRSDQRGFRHCDVRELDMHGVFVLGRDGSLTRLPKDTPVEVALKLNADGRIRTHHLHARVAGNERDGTSLVFTDADLDTYSALLHLSVNNPGHD